MIAPNSARPAPLSRWMKWHHIFALGRQSSPATHRAIEAGRPSTWTSEPNMGDFERFFIEHVGRISGYLWRMTGDEQGASDLCQEAFLRAWQHFERIRAYEQPDAWLMRVATNLALQHLRRRSTPVGAARPLNEESSPGASDPGRHFAERDLVREVLLELPAKPRAMLVLREIYGLTGEEVAEALGMKREAVKVALWRARAQFRTAYLRKETQP
jgi:RNA polymerase sigma-70 factor, ECF subfamily